jgi:potassium efflux system protein
MHALEPRIHALADEALAERRALESHVAALDGRRGLHEDELARLASLRSAARRVRDAIRARTFDMTLSDRLAVLEDQVGAIWETELTAVDDRAITVGKVATAIILLVVGLVLASFLSRLLGHLLKKRLEMEQGAAVAFQSLGYYVLVLLFFLFALRQANIPLTAFTILGGAFAIGLGFGSQTLISNFISGLILLVERPIKVGDMIDVDTTIGVVELIGLRSTRIRTFDNSHIIVPNSAFLEKNVLNWSLSDDLVRASVDVGVAYGSPTREVEELLLSAAREHRRVLDDPAPSVLFLDFADSSLAFRIYFWVRMHDLLDRRRIASDLRHRIDALFREAGIVIAFPQRDLHLDTSAPLDVRLHPEGES